eukprot:COSAG04_NODE_414_length_14737_cov_79.200779_10_plen_258_part_00
MLTKGSTGSWLRQWRRSRRMSEREPQATQPRRDDTSLLHNRHRPPSQRPLLPRPLSRPRPRRPHPRPHPRPRLRVAAGVGSFRSRRRQDRTVACSRPARHTSRRARRKRRNGTRASRSVGCAGWSATLRVLCAGTGTTRRSWSRPTGKVMQQGYTPRSGVRRWQGLCKRRALPGLIPASTPRRFAPEAEPGDVCQEFRSSEWERFEWIGRLFHVPRLSVDCPSPPRCFKHSKRLVVHSRRAHIAATGPPGAGRWRER